MTQAAHTPGPWEADDTRYQRAFRTFVNVQNADGYFVACVSADPMHSETIAANAHLIAAAPELLAALIEAQDIINACVSGNSWRGTRKRISDAITLATGAAS